MLKETKKSAACRDSMNLEKGYKILEKHSGNEIVDCRIYSTKSAGNYGNQLRCIVWAHTLAWTESGRGVGEKTTGCGYDKTSAAVDSALLDMGWPAQCHANGEHEKELKLLAEYLVGKDNFYFVSFFA